MIKIKILASDIRETRYKDADTCAITKALKRAGLNYSDKGCYISNDDSNDVILDLNCKEYNELGNRVINMYRYLDKTLTTEGVKEEPQDFEVELPI